jgi:translation initiation factor IF-3
MVSRASIVTSGGHISTEPRINERIRVPEVRLVGPAGEQIGIVSIADALRLAQEADLDLVEVAPMARPPVCKLMDYGKFKYESALKARESRKNQAQTVIKEIKLRPKIDPHDYGTKKGHVERFLKQGDKVKVTIMFRGREQSRPELGFKLLQRLAGDISELGFVESSPKQDGRNMIMVIGPHKRKTEAMAAARAERASRSTTSRGTARSGPADAGETEAVSAAATDTPQDSAGPDAAPEVAPAARTKSTSASDGPEASAAESAAPRPSASRATSTSRSAAPANGSATPRPTAPRGGTPATRATTPPKPAPPRRSGSDSVPGPRAVAADPGRTAASGRAASETER